ncbi:hypothetical protein ACFPL7_12650 [Dongia soli]|uniref:UrcA family protein n=1 Tax=Dongia soli TaxID=600628 RepID=A0ABU5EFA5_9PROT|nr:hypothetical protein [Dongia soli]MDY0885085.1 hypothetical protein [Dongia soli]
MSFLRLATLVVSGFLFLAPAFTGSAEAGAYDTSATPSLQETCHDLHVAFMAVASANQSAPRIGLARRLDALATAGCETNPRASIAKLQHALHIVTPL